MDAMTMLFTVGAVIGIAILIYQHTPSGKKWISGE